MLPLTRRMNMCHSENVLEFRTRPEGHLTSNQGSDRIDVDIFVAPGLRHMRQAALAGLTVGS